MLTVYQPTSSKKQKQALTANGAEPMNTGGDVHQDIPGYLFFAPDACAYAHFVQTPTTLEAITQADARGDNNKLYNPDPTQNGVRYQHHR